MKNMQLKNANSVFRSGDFVTAVYLYKNILKNTPELGRAIEINLEIAKKRAGISIGSVGISEVKKRIVKSNLFDRDWYMLKNYAVLKPNEDVVDHYCMHGGSTNLTATPLFDPIYYKSQIPEEERIGINNYLYHYLTVGFKKYDPNKYFDTKYYIEVYLGDASEVTPLEHYSNQSYPFECNPSQIFCNESYLKRNLDVAQARLLPLKHYLSSGKDEKRLKSLNLSHDLAAGYFIDLAVINKSDDVLVYLAYTPNNRLSELQMTMVKSYKNLGFKVILCVNSGDYTNISNNFSNLAHICFVRENIGWDFGGWKSVINKVPMIANANSITFTNDSVAFTDKDYESKAFVKKVKASKSDIVVLTNNDEIHPHFQSYFICVKKSAIKKNALSVISSLDYYIRKDSIISMIEIQIWRTFEALDLKIEALFSTQYTGNPTIKHWDKLLINGFPFVKIQLFSSNLINIDDNRLDNYLSNEQRNRIKEHIESRSIESSYLYPLQNLNLPVLKAVNTSARYGTIHQLQAFNPPESHVPTVEVPLIELNKFEITLFRKHSLLVIVHCYYLDIAEKIFEKLTKLNGLIDYFVLCTTNTYEKKVSIKKLLDNASLLGAVEVCQNRGRDVAPFLIEGKKYCKDFSLILHLHTKKSPHSAEYSNWGDFLFNNLIGNKSIIISNLALLITGTVGIVYSEHFHAVKNLRNWGFDFTKAKMFLTKLGLDISSNMLLEFPTSTMFFARTSALMPYFNYDLCYEDFDEEMGQVDGTLAHAIERTFLYVIEANGYDHYKVISSRHNKNIKAWKFASDQLNYGVNQLKSVRLLGSDSNSVKVGYIPPSCHVFKSSKTKPRLNILIPTLKPEKIYGGVSSALKVARDIYEVIKLHYDLRVIITSDEKCHDSILQAVARVNEHIVSAMPNDDYEFPSIVDYHYYESIPLSLRAGDVFFATAWWTADTAYKLQNKQFNIFCDQKPVIYLIQDYEPGFYAWSEHSSLARATYMNANTIAIINSEELLSFISNSFSFFKVYYLPYRLNEVLRRSIKSKKKEKKIIIYGRPSVDRNLFNIILKGLFLWQCDNPDLNCEYQLCFAGEPFDPSLLRILENAIVVGKVSLEEYADLLNCSSIGISLMESPHPSYPPLEMAIFGCTVVTNGYQNKDLSLRSTNIISINDVTPHSLMNALYRAVEIASNRQVSKEIRDLSVDCDQFDPNKIASLLLDK